MTTQTRTFRHKTELRNAETRTIGGLAIPFNTPSELAQGFSEVWLPGSVTFHEQGVRLFYFHQRSDILASTKTERLRLKITDAGLEYEAELPNTTLGDDMLALVSLGEVDGVSPGFISVREKMSYDPATQIDLRSILTAIVFEISLTHMGAYPSTSIEFRNDNQRGDYESVKQSLTRQRTLERVARESTLLRISQGKQ